MTIAYDPDLRNGVAPSLLHALANGVTLIDTARVYPESEVIIRRTLAEWSGPRPLLSTKLAPLSRDTFREYRPLDEAYTPDGIVASVDASLTALGVDTLDIVHLHQWWHLWTYEEELFDTLDELKRAGKVRHAAISVGDHEHDAALEAVSLRRIDGVQLILNLFESRPLSAMLPLAGMRGVGVIARCVLDSGGLSGALDRQDFAQRPFLTHGPFDEYQRRLAALRDAFTPEPAGSLPELAIRFALSAPNVSSVTVGMTSAAMVDDCLAAAAEGALPADTMGAIVREHVWTKNFYEAIR